MTPTARAAKRRAEMRATLSALYDAALAVYDEDDAFTEDTSRRQRIARGVRDRALSAALNRAAGVLNRDRWRE